MQTTMKKLIQVTLLGTVATLVACGGGGGGGGDSVAPVAVLSADQAVFENLILSPGSSYSYSWLLPSTGAAVTGTHYLAESHASLVASPLTNGAQKNSNSAYTSLATTVALPANFEVTRYLHNGQIMAEATPTTSSASYSGTGVRIDSLAADGTTVLRSRQRSGFASVPLTGLVQAAPADLAHWFNALFSNTSLLSPTAQWGANAAYISFTETNVGTTYKVLDYTGTTYGTSPTPVATGTTIAALMAAGGIVSISDSTTYTLANGSVSTVNGVPTYVATSVRPNTTTPAYHTYYEISGNVYSGEVIQNGTVIGGSTYHTTSGGVTTTSYGPNIQLRLNKVANDSLKAAVTF